MNRHLTTSIKVYNFFNEDMQQHVFGDVIKRSILAEVQVDF
jgi:hypothetical protein